MKKKAVLKASQKELICVFPFFGKKSMQLRTRLLNYIEVSNLDKEFIKSRLRCSAFSSFN